MQILLSLIFYIIFIIAYWKIFTKAGEAGWKSIIPIYNGYIICKISWKTSIFWISLLLALVGGIFIALQTTITAVIGALLYIALGVIGIMQNHKLSKSFGHGAGFTLGLIFLQGLFILILGFGSSQYIGPQE